MVALLCNSQRAINKRKRKNRKTKRGEEEKRKEGKIGEAMIIEKKESDALLVGYLLFLSSSDPVLAPIMEEHPGGDGGV